jgi:hypothetical protein
MDYVLITADGGGIDHGNRCFSQLGKISGEQILNLDSACFEEYLILHELFHTLGCISKLCFSIFPLKTMGALCAFSL